MARGAISAVIHSKLQLRRWRSLLPVLLLAGPLLVAGTSSAADPEQYRIADGVAIYLGIVPAELVRGHRQEHPEAEMHGGAPGGKHVYHVMVALFDDASGKRITDAVVKGRVSSLGLVGLEKPLESMTIGDAVTYGNYFALPGRGPYRVTLELRLRGKGQPVRTEFAFEHGAP